MVLYITHLHTYTRETQGKSKVVFELGLILKFNLCFISLTVCDDEEFLAVVTSNLFP